MVYGYIRVSTDMQDTENQKIGVNEKASQLGLKIDEWISDDGVSGAKDYRKRQLGNLIDKVQKDDIIIISEISRLGRKLFMVFRILEELMDKGVKLYSVKDAYSLDNSITSKVLAFAFGMAAEIERDMIQKRTIEGLKRKKAEGVMLGRQVGSKTGSTKLKGKKELVQAYLDANISMCGIARILGVNRGTIHKFIKDEKLNYTSNQADKKIVSKWTQRGDFLKKMFDEKKDEIIQWIKEGKNIREIRKIIGDQTGEVFTDNTLKKYLEQTELYEFMRIEHGRLRLERNVNSDSYNPEKIKEYAGIN